MMIGWWTPGMERALAGLWLTLTLTLEGMRIEAWGKANMQHLSYSFMQLCTNTNLLQGCNVWYRWYDTNITQYAGLRGLRTETERERGPGGGRWRWRGWRWEEERSGSLGPGAGSMIYHLTSHGLRPTGGLELDRWMSTYRLSRIISDHGSHHNHSS